MPTLGEPFMRLDASSGMTTRSKSSRATNDLIDDINKFDPAEIMALAKKGM